MVRPEISPISRINYSVGYNGFQYISCLIIAVPDSGRYDGRFFNNGYLNNSLYAFYHSPQGNYFNAPDGKVPDEPSTGKYVFEIDGNAGIGRLPD